MSLNATKMKFEDYSAIFQNGEVILQKHRTTASILKFTHYLNFFFCSCFS